MPIDPNIQFRGIANYEVRIYSANRRRLFAVLSSGASIDADEPIDIFARTQMRWEVQGPYVRGGFYKLDYVMNESDVGALTLEMPALFPSTWLTIDCSIEVWRSTDIDGKSWALDGSRLWLVNKVRWVGGATPRLIIGAVDTIDILRRRIVAYAAGTTYSSKGPEYIDEIIRQVIVENFGSVAVNHSRDITQFDTGFEWTHQGAPVIFTFSAGLLPQTRKGFAWRNVWEVVKELLGEAATLGTYASVQCRFLPSIDTIEFVLIVGTTGADRGLKSANPLILSEDSGTLKDVSIELDWTSTASAIYAGGAGEGANRLILYATDQARQFASPFARIEKFIENTSIENRAALQSEVNSALREARPIKRFEGFVNETETLRYGYDYALGATLVASAENQMFNCRIIQVQVTVDSKGETIRARLAQDELLEF
jgi:hypothetical protein